MPVFTIPELTALIASYLWSYQIYACIRVNKVWYEAFVPFLWRTIPPQRETRTPTRKIVKWKDTKYSSIFLELLREDYNLFEAEKQPSQRYQQEQARVQGKEGAEVGVRRSTLPSSSLLSSVSVLSRCGLWIQELNFSEDELAVPVPKPSSQKQQQQHSTPRADNPHLTKSSSTSASPKPPTAQELLLHLLRRSPCIRSLKLRWWSACSTNLVFWQTLARDVIPLLSCLDVTFGHGNKAGDTTTELVDMKLRQLPPILLDACCSGRMRKLSMPTFRWPTSASPIIVQEKWRQKGEGGGGENANNAQERNQELQQKQQILMRSLQEFNLLQTTRDSKWSRRCSRFLVGCTHLVSLKVNIIDNGNWFPALCDSHSLKKLEIEKVTSVSIQLITSVIESGGLPSLDEIIILADESYCRNPATDEDISFMLSASQTIRWRTIELPRIGPLSAEVIIEQHCSSIESVRFNHHSRLTSLQICRLLACSLKLHTFVTLTDFFYKWHANDGKLYVEDFVDVDPETGALRPWKCEASLRLLHVKVSGISSHTPSLLEDHEQCNKEIQDREHDLQRRVYERLSRFKHLEDLALGHYHEDPTRDDSHDMDSDDNEISCNDPFESKGWDFSLNNGLCMLGELREMRRFSKKMMLSPIGVDEVKWMVSQWPKLELIYGLVVSKEKEETDIDEDAAEVKRDERQATMWLEEHCPEVSIDSCDFWYNV